MPTKKPRFLVTIEPDHHLALKFLAHQRGTSVSALINEMLAPSLAPILALVKASWDESQTDLVEYLERVEARLDATLKDVSAGLAERGQRLSIGPGGSSSPVHPAVAPGMPASAAGEARGGPASMLRSGKPPLASEAPKRPTPGSNTGVTSLRASHSRPKPPSPRGLKR